MDPCQVLSFRVNATTAAVWRVSRSVVLTLGLPQKTISSRCTPSGESGLLMSYAVVAIDPRRGNASPLATPKKLPSKHLSGLSTEKGKAQSMRALT